MMKKLTVLLSCMLAVTAVFAKPISEAEALEKARQFMQGLSLPNGSRLAVKGEASAQPYKHLYVFNAEANGGFVIVSGDDRTQSILGYAARGGIDAQTMPCNVRWLLDYYEASIAQLGPDGSANAQGNVATASELPPLFLLLLTRSGDKATHTTPYAQCMRVGGASQVV